MKVIPAILEKSVLNLEKRMKLAKTLSNQVHIDIMDGNFVDNKTITIHELAHVKKKGSIIIHLMAFTPDRYFEDIKETKANKVIIHVESTKNMMNVIKKAKKYNFSLGLAISPETKIEKIKKYARYFDEILVMSVNPGFSGQKFRTEAYSKLINLRKLYPRKILSVDGGINTETIKEAKSAGANIAYAASAIWKHSNVKKAYAELKKYA